MMVRLLRAAVVGCLLSVLVAVPAPAAELQGWQTMRVIHQEGNPDHALVAKLGGNARDQLIVVNTRQSRLDIYQWLPAKQRAKSPAALDPLRPNELPMAPEWSHHELDLDELPADVLTYDLDHDQSSELIILASTRNQVLVYARDSADRWKRSHQWDLLPGTLAGKGRTMLLRSITDDGHELLLSYEQGIQTLKLEHGSRPAWLAPREQRGRRDWALADLDGDGDADLVEWSAIARQEVRWYECVDGKLLPAQALHEHGVQGFGVLQRPKHAAELLLLGGSQEGLLKRYQLAEGEESDLGRHDALPMPGGAKAAWCGARLSDSGGSARTVIVAADTAQPRLRVNELGKRGWLPEQSFPTVSNIRALVAPAAEPGTLLIWTKDAADLHRCRWESGRFTYPQAMTPDEPVSQRRILALDMVGDTAWWVQRCAAHVDLFVWDAGAKEPKRTRFADLGAKVEKVVWLGGERLLVQDAYATAAKLAVLKDGKASLSEPAHLTKVDLSEFLLFAPRTGGADAKAMRLGRLTDGVLQWLADDLHPTDQTMLPDGQKIASFVPLSGNEAWALEQNAGFIHRLKPDDSGVLRVAESIKPPHGTGLRQDAVLGLVLVDTDRIVRLSKGTPSELKLIDSIDSRVGRPSGVKEATIHRFFTTDVDGDGQDEIVLSDDRRHQLTILERTEKGLEARLSWPVFEDQTYPYGGQGDALITEPRVVVGLDADGDGRQDLAMLAHDRLLIYLAEELE
ncbi:MAG TPA: VCBS repeat-containing protein [Pirellulales bacterium]|nr:VCBS repeat-containing protein [Pirellulales bacterium]